ncbi:MAG TPA: TrkA C-terminal domain-containing protein, partial [Thermoanaerobaculia bacterium]|nr:TrkA C-terminal domain-containing protein [Thermoanaerobaculia bacterium]
VSAVLILFARPLAAFLCLLGSRLTLRERHMVSWVGLRGAAPIILATFPMVAGLEASGTIFNMVFVAVITSVLVQGPTVSLVARRLGIAEPRPEFPLTPIEVDIPRDPAIAVKRLPIEPGSEADGKKLLAIGGPDRPLVILIRRQGRLFLPTGASLLAAGDELFVLGSDESVRALSALVRAPAPA